MNPLALQHILEREVSRFEAEHILPGTALGELDHPNYASKYFKCLNLPNVSHQVLEVVWKGDQLWGTIEVLPTPSGLLLWELYSRGVKLGVSSRGWASLRSDPASKCVFVDDDFELITFDFVTEPSTRGAYLAPVQRRYRRPVPDQNKVVAISHLGHGVVAMEKVARVPGPAVLVQRIAELQRASAAALQQLSPSPGGVPLSGAVLPGGLQAAMPPSFKPSGLDNLLCFGHYVVHQSAPYLDREQHARDYRAHLVIFTARAHLADERMNTGSLSRGDIDNVILNKLVTKDSFDPASTSFATRLDQPPHAGARFGIGIPSPPQRSGANGATAPLCITSTPGTATGYGGVMSSGMLLPSSAVAAAAAETQGPSGIDASYAVVHAASGGGAAAGDLESWAMHPHALNSNCCIQDHSAYPSVGGWGQQQLQQQHGANGSLRPSHPSSANGHHSAPGYAGDGPWPGQGHPCHHGQQHHQHQGHGGHVEASNGRQVSGGLGSEDEQVRAWLAQLPGGESMAQGFLDIRASLIAFAQLYQLHQKKVEAALLRQVQAGGPGVSGGGPHHPHNGHRL
ncbi:hypothetical protein GPECTOR_26g595 [Gonium pectorale]|uniref:Uncharacterized protein n=1 Tax=Gonium pectorale TaxID=33097 RepID=A0A150GFS9_GONPE|nr:hypothetical protein GPECTOR_26g595 [Gonium pectorale]|eukprot:KXZ48692.1 hypothetical protein GPECTOR_26g595 [Gonium pectorale]